MGALDTAIDGALDPLDGAIDGVVGDKRKANVYNAVRQNPDEFAQAAQLSRSTGLPAPVVARNLPQVKQRADLDALDGVIEQSPAVRKAMDDPTFAILARDDAETLAEIERTAGRRAGGRIGGPAYQRPDEMKASQGPEASFASVVSGMFSALPQGAEQTRQGMRMQFADAIGSPEMSIDAMRRYQRAQTETVLSTPQFDSLTAAGLYSGGVSLVQQAPGLVASILMRTPLPGLANIGAQTEATAYGKYRSRGATPGEALAGGAGEGAVEVATELLPMSFLVNRFGKAGAGEFLAGLLAREIPSEQIATLVQDAIDTAVANPDKTWQQYREERLGAAYQTLVATVAQAGAMGAISTVAQRVAAPTMQAEAAGQEAETLAQLSQLAAASKLRERDPQTFEQYVEAAAPGQEVYLDARTLQQSGVDLAALAQTSPAVAAQITEALATGGDITIPVSEYAARLAGTDLDTALLPHLRASEDALSQDEAQRFYQGQAEEFKNAAAKVMEDKATDDAWQASARAVETQLLDQLQQTGRFTPDVNNAYATLMRDFYVATAARLGTTPEEMAARYPIRIAAQSADGGQVLSQEDISAAEKAGFDSSQVWLHGTTKDFTSFKAGKKGVNELGEGIYFTKSPLYANAWARGEGAHIMPVLLKRGDFINLDEFHMRASYGDLGPYRALAERIRQRPENMPEPARDWVEQPVDDFARFIKDSVKRGGLNTWLDRAGYVGAYNPYSQIPDQVVVFRPENIRSVNAKFNPKKASSKNILAQAANKVIDLLKGGDPSGKEGQGRRQEVLTDGGTAPLDMGQFFQADKPTGFDKWTEGAPVIMADETLDYQGGPAVFEGFHGTTHPDITKFRTDVGNREGALGRGPYLSTSREDVSENYAGVGPDLTNRIEREKEDIADAFWQDDFYAEEVLHDYFDAHDMDIEITEDNLNDLKDEHADAAMFEKAQAILKGESDGLVMPVWVKFKNPFDIRPNGLDLVLEYEQDEEGDIVPDSEKGTALDFIQALRSTGEAWGIDTADLEGYIYENARDGVSAYDVWQKAQGTIYAENDPDGAPSGPGQFMQEVAREAGYDGIIQDADMHFGSGRRGFGGVRLPSMAGVVPGTLHLMPFDGKQIKSSIGNSGAFDPNNPDILAQNPKGWGSAETGDHSPPDPLKPGVGSRAVIRFGEDITQQPSVIALFNNADLSSFLHEMGHFQLEVLAHIASQPNAPAEIVQDMERVFKWFGVPDLAAWQAMSLEEKRPYHEQFARGFEAYLFEGKAPSQELTSIFHRFRAWLISVYKSIKALNVEISDDIRGVFDRLVATDEAIKAAEAARAYTPLFPDDPEAQALAAKATQDATDELQRRSLRDMRWLDNARGRILKQMQADAKAKRQSVEAEVRAEVAAMPVWQAKDFIKSNPDTDRDMVAEMFGFTSGDHLGKEIKAAGNRAVLIEGMTDQRMLERYGDLTSPDAMARAVDEAIHNDARARFVATELKALNKAAGPVRAISKAAKDFAETMVARKQVKAIKPARHAAAEARAAKAAEKALAAGDTVLAADEKRNQLIQNYATRASYDALTEVDKALRYFAKLDGEGTRKNLDAEYLDQIDALLERFDFRKSVSNKDAKKRATLVEWVQGQRDEGFEPDIPPDLLAEAMRKPYKEMTLEELRGLVDTVKQIEHLGRLKRKLLTAKDEREFKAIRDEIAASIAEHAKGMRDLRTRNLTSDALKDAGARFLAMHRKMASVSREMDGFKDGGPMWEYLIRSMNSAGDRESGMRADATARLHALVKPLLASGKMGGKGIYFESLGGSFNREERIAIALNLGNAGNMQRLLDGEGWTMTRLRPLLDTITAEEAEFVQSVWDFFESYRPEIAAKERRIYGKEPVWVEPVPITLGGKELKGGYYPVKYDRARSERAAAHEDAESAKAQMKGAYTSATTRRSFTKTRAEEVTGRPLLYSFAGIYQGTNEVIHDLAWHEWLIDANRLVRSLSGTISMYYGDETRDLFKKAIEDIAAGDVPAQNVFERGINHLRMGATVAGLGWNFSTALLQPFGLTQSMVRIGPAWVVKGLSQWIKSPIATGNDVAERSAFMRDRARTMQREINEIQNQVRGSKLDPVRATFFLMIQKMQMVADMPTWLGAYEKAIAEGNAEDRAVSLADQAVMDTQGSGQVKDLAQIQRGGPLLKLWTNFYSFFNTTYNLAVEKTKEKGSDPKLYPSLAIDYLLLFVIPCAMVTLVKAALQGEDDEDELVKKLAADQISYLLGTMVGLRELTAAMQKLAGVEQFKSSYGGPAGLRMFQEVDKLSTQMAQGEIDAALLKAINNTAGNLLHYPSGQINRTAGGVAAIVEGKTDNPMAVLLGPPPKK